MGRDGLVDPGTLREPAHDAAGGVPVQSAAVRPGDQGSVGAFTDRRVDSARGAWCQGDECGLPALADDADHAVSVCQRQVGQLGAARLRNAWGVQREQAGQGVAVAARQAGLDQERAELGAVESEPGGLLGHLRTSHMNRWGVFEQLFLDASHGRTR